MGWTSSALIDSWRFDQALRFVTKMGVDNSSTNIVPAGSLLVGTRVGVGKAAVTSIDVAISQDLTGLVLDTEQAVVDFVVFALMSPALQAQFRSATRGSTIKGVPRRDLLGFKVLLPPLNEQAAIAHALRSVYRAKEQNEQVVESVKHLKKSALRHLFAFASDSVPIVPLVECAADDRPICYGILKPGPDISDGVPYIKVRDYPNGSIGVGGLKRTSNEIAAQYRRSQLRAGDVLVSIRGTTGRVTIVPDELEGANITQDTARITPSGSFDRDFLAYWLQSEMSQQYIREWTRGAAVKGINIRELRQLSVPRLSIAHQRDLASSLSAIDRKLVAEVHQGDAVRELFRSLLHELMMGQTRVGELEVE